MKAILSKLKKYMTKRNIMRIMIGISLIILLIVTINYINNKRAREIAKAEELYELAHNLYFYGEGLEYAKENGKFVTIDRSNSGLVDRYFKVSNYENTIGKIFSEEGEKKVKTYLGVINLQDDFYIREIGRGLSGYFGTTFTIKKSSSKKITFVAHSKFCEIAHSTNGRCEAEEYYYTIDKPFVLVKEEGKWKINEYTSVFEFSDQEIK